MKAMFLGGNSIHNKKWIEKLENNLRELFDETKIQDYKHWQTGDDTIDTDYEISTLMKKVKDLGNYIIVAKSVGTYITMKAIQKGINPEKVIFFGFPYKWLVDKGFKKETEGIRDIKIPILFIQNSEYPFCSYQELITFLNKIKIKNYKAYELQNNNTHDYENYSKIKEIVSKFIRK